MYLFLCIYSIVIDYLLIFIIKYKLDNVEFLLFQLFCLELKDI